MTNLGIALTAYQHKLDLTGGQLAKLMGIPEPTLVRLKQGRMVDARTLAAIIVWLTKVPCR